MNRFSLTADTLALHDFSARSLEDFSGNGFDLSGTHSFREVAPQVFELAPGSDVSRAVRDAALAQTDPCTIEVTGRFYSAPTQQAFVSFTASGETLATNTLWQLGTQNASQLRWLHEHGSGGTDAALASTGATEALPAPGADFYSAGVRYADGTVRLFLNGRQHGAPSVALTAAAGGTSALMRVMLGATSFGLRGIRVRDNALTPAEIAESYAQVMGPDAAPPAVLGKLWVGAPTNTSVTVVARMAGPVAGLALDVSGGVSCAPQDTDADNVARFDLTGLDPDTEYTYALPGGAVAGRFRTLPAASGDPASFTIAFGGDAVVGSAHPVFTAVAALDPLMFIHMGDLHYQNISANSPALFHAAFDDVFASTTQHRLYRTVPTAYVWDDHDYGGNNSDGTAASKPAAAAVYRSRVPHYPLPHATAIYQTWDVGRVRFVMTDQRSEATPDSATDNASKSMLGATQKTWFKDLISNSPGMLIVWVCPRWFANANHTDSWNNFSTERRELVDHIKANAHGRVVVLEADQHTLAIDDGSHVDHATGGGEPLPCFRAAPLDQTVSALGASGSYSHGEFNNRGQFGTMAVADSGGSSIGVTWTGHDSAGTVLTSYAFSVAL